MIEIGVNEGGSLSMWKEYLGPDSKVIGIDINPACKAHEDEGIEVYIGSQDEPGMIESIFAKHPDIDIILDDGSHKMNHMIASFELMYERMQPNGVYIVEDTHTCYWKEYGGGIGREGSFMEFVKSKMDEMNAVHTRGKLPVSDFTRHTDCIACYDSIVVFERRRQGERRPLITKGM
ncbi:MAG: CmcI family methyltransferase [Woeseiaceae bacterium]